MKIFSIMTIFVCLIQVNLYSGNGYFFKNRSLFEMNFGTYKGINIKNDRVRSELEDIFYSVKCYSTYNNCERTAKNLLGLVSKLDKKLYYNDIAIIIGGYGTRVSGINNYTPEHNRVQMYDPVQIDFDRGIKDDLIIKTLNTYATKFDSLKAKYIFSHTFQQEPNCLLTHSECLEIINKISKINFSKMYDNYHIELYLGKKSSYEQKVQKHGSYSVNKIIFGYSDSPGFLRDFVKINYNKPMLESERTKTVNILYNTYVSQEGRDDLTTQARQNLKNYLMKLMNDLLKAKNQTASMMKDSRLTKEERRAMKLSNSLCSRRLNALRAEISTLW